MLIYIYIWIFCGVLSTFILGFIDWSDGIDIKLGNLISAFLLFIIAGPIALIYVGNVIFGKLSLGNMVLLKGKSKKSKKIQ